MKMWRSPTRLVLVMIFSVVMLAVLGSETTGPMRAAGATLYVALGGACGGMPPCYSTVQAAVDAASSGHVKVAGGTYTDVNVHPHNDVTTTGVVLAQVSTNYKVDDSLGQWGDSRPSSANHKVEPDIWVGVAVVTSAPNLSIIKSAPSLAMTGSRITYTLVISNSGDAAASSLIITDAVPAGANYVSGGTLGGGVVQWTIASLAANSSTTVQFVVSATQTITNSVYGVSANGGYSAVGVVPIVTIITADGDNYEPDNTCAQAGTILADGSIQTHNFHPLNDEDWVKFQGQANKSYIIQVANVGDNVDAVAILYSACGQAPLASDSNAFGPTVEMQWTAPSDGLYYMRVMQNDPSVYGEGTNYDLSVAVDTQPPAAPRNVRALAADQSLIVQWRKSTELDVAGYRVRWGTFSGGPYSGSYDVSGADTTYYQIINLTNGIPYYVVVAAIDSSNNVSPPSAEVGNIPSVGADASTPVLALNRPSAATLYTTTVPALTVGGVCTDTGNNLSRIQVRNITKGTEKWNYSLAGGAMPCQVDSIPLNDGDNQIQATVYDAANNSSNTSITIRRITGPEGAVVIVGGRNNNSERQSNIDYAANHAYNIFRSAGFGPEDIMYLSPSPQDTNSDGLSEVISTTTPANVHAALQWAATKVSAGRPFYLYLVDHGNIEYYCADGCTPDGNHITSADLDSWLDELEAASGCDQVTVIIEACHSGSFIDKFDDVLKSIAKEKRVVIASTGRTNNAYASAQGAYFSDAFFSAVVTSKSLKENFDQGKAALEATPFSQTPWLDDNGDGLYNLADGALASSRYIASYFGGMLPQITMAVVTVTNGIGTVQAIVQPGDEPTKIVWAAVYAPSFHEPTITTLNLVVPLIELSPDPNQDGLYTTHYNAFSESGTYQVVIYAQDQAGNQALPKLVQTVPTPLVSVALAGPTTGIGNTAYAFTAAVNPVTATTPITYIWQATGLSPVIHTNSLSYTDLVTFTWPAETAGLKIITVTATNGVAVTDAKAIAVNITPTSSGGIVVIVAGHNNAYDLQSNILYAANLAYRTFLSGGIPKTHLRYLSTISDARTDADGDGASDVYTTSASSNVEAAITNWAASLTSSSIPFYLYLMDHGGVDYFMADGSSDTITPDELDGWLNQLETAVPGVKVNVIIEAAHAGSFIDGAFEISKPGRVVIASTSAALVAYASAQGVYFSDAFFPAFGQGQSLWASFHAGRAALQAASLNQDPWLDDNGDATANGLDDGAAAASRVLFVPLEGVSIQGPLTGTTTTPYTFTATVNPIMATTPVTYIWQATGQSPVTHASGLSDTLAFAWSAGGAQAITVTATNVANAVTETHTMTIGAPPGCSHPLSRVDILGATSGYTGTLYTFTSIITPSDATTPVIYTWSPAPVNGQGTAGAVYQWATPGVYTLTLTAENCGGVVTDTHAVVISAPPTSAGDTNEPDNTCTQARSVITDGSVQAHTFHVAGDVDWVSFQGISGTTYLIEARTPADSLADVVLEVYDTCDHRTDGQNYSFTPDVRLQFKAPADGVYYLRLNNNNLDEGGPNVSYELSVRSLSSTPTPGVLVLVAGRLRFNDLLQSNIYNVTNNVYRLFRAHGYPKERIRYLANDDQDVDSDGNSEVWGQANSSNLQQAISEWAADKVGPDRALTVYLMDHGGYDALYLNGRTETVAPDELNSWLNQLEQAAPGVRVNVMVDACHSGSFIDLPKSVSKPGRVVMASAGSDTVAYATEHGAIFSDASISALERGASLYGGFEEGQSVIQVAHPDQTPWLDDDGDSQPNEAEDGLEAARRGFAYAGTFPEEKWPPYIVWAEVVNVKNGQGTIRARVEDDHGVLDVWAVIYKPSYQLPSPTGEEIVQENLTRLKLEDPDKDKVYTVLYDGFNEIGQYRIVLYAVDTDNAQGRPRAVLVRTGWKVYLPVVLKLEVAHANDSQTR